MAEVGEQQANASDNAEEALMPAHLLESRRRLTGPTIDTAHDGLTQEEVDQIDFSLFKDEMRLRPYNATMDDGSKKLLFRLRPRHWGQRSGGVWYPEGSERDYVPPDYIPGRKWLSMEDLNSICNVYVNWYLQVLEIQS